MFKSAMLLFVSCIALASMTINKAEAYNLVYEQAQIGNDSGWLAAGHQAVADDFQLASTTTIRAISWPVFQNDSVDNFKIWIYEDNPGGAPHVQYALGDTPTVDQNGQYVAVLPTAFTAESGRKYWIVVYNDVDSWGWNVGAGNGVAAYSQVPPDFLSWDFFSSDLAFALYSGLTFNLQANTPNQSAVLGYLQPFVDTADGIFFDDLATLASLPDGEFQSALDELSPEPYAGLRDAGLRVVRAGTATVGERLNSLRLTKTAGIDGKLMFAAASEVMTDTGPASAVTNKSGFSLWARPYRYVADQDGKGSNFGYKHDFMGMTLGADKAIGKNALFGFMVGKSSGDVDYSVVDAESDMDSMYGGVYGAMTTGDIYLHTQAAYFKHEFDTTRNLTFIDRIATSDHDADEIAVSLGGEYLGISSPCGWNLVPGLAAEYSYYDEESFTESGAGSFDLDVDGETYDSLVSRLGVRVNKAFKQERTVLIPELKLEWSHEYLETDRDVKATFAGAGAGSFKVEGVDAEDDTFVVGIGLTGVMDETSAFYVNYDNEFASDYSMWGVSFGYKYSF